MATTDGPSEAGPACSGRSANHAGAGEVRLPCHRPKIPPVSVGRFQRPLANLEALGEQRELHAKGSDTASASHSIGLLSLSKDVRWPPLFPQQNESKSSFWQEDGSFSCDWGALRAGEAFCSSVNACCVSCLSRALGGPSELTSALLEKLRTGAKTAIQEEVSHLIQTVKASAAAGADLRGQDGSGVSDASEDLTQQLLKHPALQAVAFLSVHERRLAVFEVRSAPRPCQLRSCKNVLGLVLRFAWVAPVLAISYLFGCGLARSQMWLDRWQVLSRSYQCTCGSAQATSAGLNRIASGSASANGELLLDSESRACTQYVFCSKLILWYLAVQESLNCCAVIVWLPHGRKKLRRIQQLKISGFKLLNYVKRQSERTRKKSPLSKKPELSVELMKKQQQLLLATERVKALEKVRQDPTFGIVERAQQQPPASSDAKSSNYKESLSFIADKCTKLANLTQLIQQQFPQSQTTGLLRPSWEPGQAVAAAGEAPDTPADGGLLGALRELQTPHVSMHSPHSLRARRSSYVASPVEQTKNPGAAPRFRQPPTGEEDARPRGQKRAPADGWRTHSPLRPGNLRAVGEPQVSSVRAVIPPMTSPDNRHRNNATMEPGSNKRTRDPEEATLRDGWRRALNPAVRHAELDIDAEVAWQPVDPTAREDPMQEAVWVDSFLRRRPEAS
ncbi:uncharacterized protein EMH_0014800 [Eimeria mitis]|uniref:Uncharacterized protein n=1 Tax=Eimeria mitis TaxID=44415 RepID=U6JUF0_9EIME|nr:uncharacterized protein EMH_0014800 [Eimeria mitis]CDJ28366.1 hypothetical protein, conserved [Eimeria mitis]